VTLIIVVLGGTAVVGMAVATRQRSAQVVCLSNLGQIARANQRMDLQLKDKGNWARRFMAESGLPDTVYRCPSAWETSDWWGSVTEAWKTEETISEGKLWVVCTYTLNIWTLPADPDNLRGGWALPGDPNNLRGGSQFYVSKSSRAAARVPVLGDGAWQNSWPLETDPTPPDLRSGDRQRQGRQWGADENMLGRYTIARHGLAINVGFLDGHAEAVQLKDLKTLTWHEGWQPRAWDPPLPAE
jgi:prepilin-type processing-associated H-X9-DG protein